MKTKRAAMICCMLICLFIPGTSHDERQDSQEYALKAAFIYNFVLFTDWPDTVGNTLKICIYGRDPFGEHIDKLGGKTANRRVISIQRTNRLSELKDCQVVFIAPGSIGQWDEIKETLKGHPVLTVSDSPMAAMHGVMIDMYTAQNRIAFHINLSAVRSAGLSLSSNMLRLAGKVYQ